MKNPPKQVIAFGDSFVVSRVPNLFGKLWRLDFSSWFREPDKFLILNGKAKANRLR